MFNSNRMSAANIFIKIGEKFIKKDPHQIRIKFRAYTPKKCELKKSGAAGSKITEYDEEMDKLWDTRKKFSVPERCFINCREHS